MAMHLISYVPWLRHLSATELESLLEDVETIGDRFSHLLTSVRTDVVGTKRIEVPSNAKSSERLGDNAPLDDLLVELDQNSRGDPKLHLYSSESALFLVFLSVADKTGRSHRIRLVSDDRNANVERLSKQKTTVLCTALPLSFDEAKRLVGSDLEREHQKDVELQEPQTELFEAVTDQPRTARRRRETRRRPRRAQPEADLPATHVQIFEYAMTIMLEPLFYATIFALLGLSTAYAWYTKEPDLYVSTDSTRTIRDIAYSVPVGSTPERWYYVNAQKLFRKAVAIRERGIRLEAVGPKYGYIDNMA